jgi:hypothetical protein
MSGIIVFMITLLWLLCASMPAQAQEPQAPQFAGSLVEYPIGGPFSLDPDCVATLRVVLHVMRDDQGQGGVTEAQALEAFTYLNDIFATYNIAFQHLDDGNKVRFHDDGQYYPMYFAYHINLASDYTVSDAINIFIVDRAENDPTSWNGFVQQTPDRVLFIRSEHRANSSIVHEMGHVFGLWHTHGKSTVPLELVTRGIGANCETAGDMLCDTPAEPFNNDLGISGYVIGGTCTYTGTFQDANDDYYTPDTHNFMGYSINSCRNSFSPSQVALMREYIANDHYAIFNTVVGRDVRFANIVGGQEATVGDITIYFSDGTEYYTDTSPFDIYMSPCIYYGVRTQSERLTVASVTEKHQNWNENFTTHLLKKELRSLFIISNTIILLCSHVAQCCSSTRHGTHIS